MKKRYLLIILLLLFIFKAKVSAKSIYCTYGTNVSVILGISENGNLVTTKNDKNPLNYLFDTISVGAFIKSDGNYYCPDKVSYSLIYNTSSKRNDYRFSFISTANYPNTIPLVDSKIDNTPSTNSKTIDHTCAYGTNGTYIINYYTDGTIGPADSRYKVYNDIPTTGDCLASIYICTGEILYKSPQWNNNNCNKIYKFTGSFVQTDPKPSNGYTQSANEISCSTNRNLVLMAKAVGYIILICLGPILVIVLGMMDFTKAVTSSDKEAMSKATKALIRRLIAAFAIFIAPIVIRTGLGLINNLTNDLDSENHSRFGACTKCIFDPNDCQVPSNKNN